jgi:hypothetical protein
MSSSKYQLRSLTLNISRCSRRSWSESSESKLRKIAAGGWHMAALGSSLHPRQVRGNKASPVYGSPPIDPRVARRKSVDYAARRSGGRDAGRGYRRSSGNVAPRQSNWSRNGSEPEQVNSHSSNSNSSEAAHPPVDPRVSRRRSVSYAARRSGADPENVRRRSLLPSSHSPSTPAATHVKSSPPMDPRVARRRSVDYAARRSGSTREQSPPHGASPLTDERVARRRSVDYAARRSKSTREQSHSRSPTPSPVSTSPLVVTPTPNPSNSPPIDPRVARRRSVDYAARRSGGDWENTRNRSSNFSSSAPPTPASSGPATGLQPSHGPQIDPRVARRRSVNYEARRSGGVQKMHRSLSVSKFDSRLSPSNPAQGGPKMDARVRNRRSVDYAARRSDSDGQEGRGTREHGGGPTFSLNGSVQRLERQIPIRRKKMPSYDARRSGDHTRQRRLHQEYTLAQVKSALAMHPGGASQTPSMFCNVY